MTFYRSQLASGEEQVSTLVFGHLVVGPLVADFEQGGTKKKPPRRLERGISLSVSPGIQSRHLLREDQARLVVPLYPNQTPAMSSPSSSSSPETAGAAVNRRLHETLPTAVADKIPHIPETKAELKSEVKEEAKAAVSAGAAQIRSLVAGGFGGVCAVVVGHPFDLVKVRLQTAEKGVYSSAIDVVRRSVAKDGLRRGLYAGVSAPLVGVTPMCMLPPPLRTAEEICPSDTLQTQSLSPSGDTTSARALCAAPAP